VGYFSIWHWLIVLAIVIILFGGRGKVVSIFADFAKGLKAFKKGLNEESEDNTNRISSKNTKK